METGKSNKHRTWVYLLPLLHLIACLIGLVGYVIPSVQYLGIVWVGVMLVDMPVSAIGYATAWKHGTFTAIWVVVVGTLWWYLLSRGAGLLIAKLRAKSQPSGHMRSAENS
jgi:hypothetical protein